MAPNRKKQKIKDSVQKQRQKFSLIHQIRNNKKAFIVYSVLAALTALFTVRCAVIAQWESVFVCVLALLLYLIPPFVEKTAKIELPTTLEILAFVFVFCAQILGELGNFYIRFPLWDSLLHTVCGFMFAAVGFCLVDIMNKGRFNKFDLSPLFLSFIAFCFSMTIGVFWEFVEFGIDLIFHTDMQKDFVISDFFTVKLDPEARNKVVAVKDILQTVITTESGEVITLEGYLDLGIYDTMKDLLVNFVGAIIFSFIGHSYVKKRGKGKFAAQFIPVSKQSGTPQEISSEDGSAEPDEASAEKADGSGEAKTAL